jgi:hypothetical protein
MVLAFGLLLAIDPAMAKSDFERLCIGHRGLLGRLLRQAKPHARRSTAMGFQPGFPL